jgi:hypothetical protein
VSRSRPLVPRSRGSSEERGVYAAAQQSFRYNRRRARDLNLRRGPPGRGCSWPITPERAGACKNLQDVPEQGSRIGLDRPSGETADPDFPGSAAMCRHCLPPVTPEAAGSSPVDPANYPSGNKGVPAQGGSVLANWPESAERARLQAGELICIRPRFLAVSLGEASREMAA